MSISISGKLVSYNMDDKLGAWIIIATVVHAIIILGIGFSNMNDDSRQALPQTMEVTLVNTRTDKSIEDADYLAQSNQEGGGNVEQKVLPETMFPAVVPTEQMNEVSPTPPVYIPAPKQPKSRTELMTQEESSQKISTDIFPVKETKSENLTAAELISRSMDIASLETEIGQSLQAYSKMPRNKVITARTKEYKYAAYMDAWRRKVERIGNLNFPAEARSQKLSGDLILDVMINKDGTISKIEVLKSSNHKVLDDAAMHIVHMAAPYAPFTESMLEETDVLHIIRTWKFMGGNTVTAR